MNPQAQELNETIKKQNPTIFELLSEKGKKIFFPKLGILSQAADAKGKKINASIGIAVEDDSTPMRLKALSSNIDLDPKDAFPYAPSYGKPELRKKWQELIKEKNPSLKNKISLPVTTNALTHGLSIMGYLFVDENEKIIISDKFWGNYNLIFVNAYNAILNPFNLFKDNRFDIQSFKETIDNDPNEKKIILLNFPNNPTGYTPTETEVEMIIKTIKQSAENGNKLLVICDDAYFGLVYEENIYKESIFSKLADLHENVLAVKIDGPTKEDYVWGFRVGFITYSSKGITDDVCQALEAKTAGAIRGNISNASHLSQSLLLKAYEDNNYKQQKKEKYNLLKSRYKKVQQVLENRKYQEYFKALPFNSGYFMCVELQEGLDAESVRQTLLKEYDTGIIAIKNLIRIAFSSVKESDIPRLFENIYSACKKIDEV